MEVVLIHFQKEELEHISDLFKGIEAVKKLSAYDKFPKAQEYLERNNADIVLLDADNDVVSWAIFYRKIKEINGNAKVVLMSRSDSAAVRAHELGVWDYLMEPVKKNQLERIIEKAFDLYPEQID